MYDFGVTRRGKLNTYTFIYNEKKIVLIPIKLKHTFDSQKTRMVTAQASRKALHLLNKH